MGSRPGDELLVKDHERLDSFRRPDISLRHAGKHADEADPNGCGRTVARSHVGSLRPATPGSGPAPWAPGRALGVGLRLQGGHEDPGEARGRLHSPTAG